VARNHWKYINAQIDEGNGPGLFSSPAFARFAQQTTGQLLISSGFNPIAATTPDHVVLERVESGGYAYSRVWLMELSL
jgi:hypothetical protein